MEEMKIKLADVTIKKIGTMKINELRELARIEGLKVGGSKKELLDRLLVKKAGRSDRYAGQQTKCRICGARVIVKGTDSKPLGDGRTLVTRNVKCLGKHKHTYPIKNIVAAQETAG